MKSGPRLPQLEEALAQKLRPNTAIKKINKIKKKKKFLPPKLLAPFSVWDQQEMREHLCGPPSRQRRRPTHTPGAAPARPALSRAPHGPHPHTHRCPQKSRSGRWDAGQVLTWRRRRLSTGLPHAGGQTPEPTSKEVPTQGPDGGSPHGSLGLRTSAGHVPGGEEPGARGLRTDGGPGRRLRPADADHSEERCRRGPCSFTSRETRRLTTRPHRVLKIGRAHV